MPEIVAGARYATFINTFRCRPSDQDEVVRINVDIVEQVASRFPGFVSATVHRSVDGTVVINYLQWQSPEHLAAMQRSSEFQAIARRFAWDDRVRTASVRGRARRRSGRPPARQTS